MLQSLPAGLRTDMAKLEASADVVSGAALNFTVGDRHDNYLAI